MRGGSGALFVFLSALAADLALKAAARLFPAEIRALPWGFRLALHVNPGVSFGLAGSWGVTAGLCGALALAAFTFVFRPSRKGARVALALLWAGALSNVAERAFLGGVTDFLFVPSPVSLPWFDGLFINLADVWLLLGAALLAFYLVLRGSR